MPPPSGIKLRDSCHACAASKVKCSKEKPTCARCGDRDMPCRYLVTQRTGRKFARRSNSSSSGHSSPLSPGEAAAASVMDSPFMTWAGRSLEDWLAPPLSLPPLAGAATTTTCAPSILPTTRSLGGALPPWHDILSASTSTTDTGPDLSEFGGLLSSPFATTNQPLQQLGGDTQSSISDLQEPDCLMVALQLMGQLSSPCPTTAPNGLQMVMDENRGILESISAMMQFSGSHDGYFLVVASLVVSRVLGGYAAAVHHGSSSMAAAPEMGLGAKTALDAGERDPQTAQRVLSELYQVQKLVDQLGSRAQKIYSRRNRMGGSEASS